MFKSWQRNNRFIKSSFAILAKNRIGWKTKLFVWLRFLSCPFADVEGAVPQKGKLLDLGGGHGIFGLNISSKYPECEVFSLDPDKSKTTWIASNKLRIISDTVGSKFVKQFSHFFDTITIIDALYLLPGNEKLLLLKQAYKLLKHKDSSRLIIKVNGVKRGLSYWWLKFQEKAMQSFFGLTFSRYKKTFFASAEEYENMLKKAGFCVLKSKRVFSILPYPHFLIVVKPKIFSKKLKS